MDDRLGTEEGTRVGELEERKGKCMDELGWKKGGRERGGKGKGRKRVSSALGEGRE